MRNDEIIKEQVLRLLKSEGIDINDKESAIKSLSECVAPNVCISIYLRLISPEK